MIANKKVLAIIPARGGSKGLPRKNILNLCGRPLIGWPIKAASSSCYVDRIVVSTEDMKIAEVAASQGATVPFLRPKELAIDTATSFSVIEHVLEELKLVGEEYKYVVLLEPTSPLTDAKDIDQALERLERGRAQADSIVGVSEVVAAHPVFDVEIRENGLIKPYMHENFSFAGRRQEITPLYFFEGSLYISDVSVLLEQKSFYHERTLAYAVPKWKSFEIDDLVDFICVEAIMKNIHQIKGE